MTIMKIGLLFPGQGSQYVGMCKPFFDQYQMVRDIYNEASDAIQVDLKKLCFEGTLEEITRTEIAQPLILTVSFAMFQVFREKYGLDPSFLAGHSLGEYSALTCANAIPFSDAIRLVQRRGEIINESINGGTYEMRAVINADPTEVERMCNEISIEGNYVAVANYNTQNQIVISGHSNAVEQVVEKLKHETIKVISINTKMPFHSALLHEASRRFREELNHVKIVMPKYPVVSNVIAQPYDQNTEIKDILSEHISHPVRWKDSIDYMIHQNATMFIEMGPGNKMRNMLRRNWDFEAYTFDLEQDQDSIAELLSSRDDGKESIENYKTLVTKCLVEAVSTKNQNWDDEAYEQGVAVPYRKIQSVQNKIDISGEEPRIDEVKDCLKLLLTIFHTKMVPEMEQKERFDSILKETNTYHLFAGMLNSYKD